MVLEVILGLRLKNDGSMEQELIDRIELGLSKYKEINPDYLCLCGGMPNKKAALTEASQMFDYIISKGYSFDNIICEDKSITTNSNARNLRKILKNETIDKIYVVSSKYHFFRTNFPKAQNLFKKYFKNTEIIPVYKED